MINKLILAWRNPENRRWTPVGNLSYKDKLYYFNYTNGVKGTKFQTFGQMNSLNTTYVSEKLFPIFENRLLSKSRPEYNDFLNWLGVDNINTDDRLMELSRSRGIRATDELQLFPIPEKNNNNSYEVLFFSHGISHISEHYIQRLSKLNINDTLPIMKDVQNEVDPLALSLRAQGDPAELLGYCPAFFVKDFNKLMEINGNKNVHVTVEKINSTAPLQLKLLCKLTTKWPSNFKPFSGKDFNSYK